MTRVKVNYSGVLFNQIINESVPPFIKKNIRGNLANMIQQNSRMGNMKVGVGTTSTSNKDSLSIYFQQRLGMIPDYYYYGRTY